MYAVALTLSVEGLKTSKEEQHALFDCTNDAGCDDDSAIGKWGDHLKKCPDDSFKDCIWGVCYCTYCIDKPKDCRASKNRQ